MDKIDIVSESFRVKWYENKRKQTKWINFKEEFEIIPSFWAKIRKSFWSNLLIGFITLVITTITKVIAISTIIIIKPNVNRRI